VRETLRLPRGCTPAKHRRYLCASRPAHVLPLHDASRRRRRLGESVRCAEKRAVERINAAAAAVTTTVVIVAACTIGAERRAHRVGVSRLQLRHDAAHEAVQRGRARRGHAVRRQSALRAQPERERVQQRREAARLLTALRVSRSTHVATADSAARGASRADGGPDAAPRRPSSSPAAGAHGRSARSERVAAAPPNPSPASPPPPPAPPKQAATCESASERGWSACASAEAPAPDGCAPRLRGRGGGGGAASSSAPRRALSSTRAAVCLHLNETAGTRRVDTRTRLRREGRRRGGGDTCLTPLSANLGDLG